MKNNRTKLTKSMMLVLGMMLAAVLIAGCTAPEANPLENSNLLANEQPPPNSIPNSVNSVDDEAPTFLAEDTAPDTVETPPPPEAEYMIELAKRDLAKRLSIEPEEIQVTVSLQKEWPDASLGCPQPETVYAQVVTKGYLILFEAKEKPYEYHTDLDQQAILCVSGNLPMIPVTPGEIDDGQPWVPVD